MTKPSLLTLSLVALVALRFLVHAFYVPVFEGPDEPFHLARAVAFVDQTADVAMAGTWVGEEIAGAIEAYPCGPDLAREFECPPFAGSSRAEFNILRSAPAKHQTVPPFNYESHHPPLYYLGGAVFLAASRILMGSSDLVTAPAFQLLTLRLFSVFLTLVALFGPIYQLARARSAEWLWGCSLLLLAPGASESLARAANDVGVFVWAALLVWAIDRSVSSRWIALIVVLGPLLKLTALPIVAFALTWLFLFRPVRHAILVSLAAFSFLPLQLLRGYLRGGTVEANSPARSLEEPIVDTALGLLRST